MKCPVCNTTFNPVRPSGYVAKTCSRVCAQRMNARKQDQTKRNYGIAPCAVCSKEFVKKAEHAKYCSQVCLRKAHYLNLSSEQKQKKVRKKVTKQKIGLHIRDEYLKTPKQEAKWLWDGLGRWSVKYWPDIRECLECNTTVYRHAAHGVCERCYSQLKNKDAEALKELKQRSYQKARAKGTTSSQVAKMWIEKAKAKEIPITPITQNLLDNLENL